MTQAEVNDLIARLVERQKALGDGCDVKSLNAQAAYDHTAERLATTIVGLANTFAPDKRSVKLAGYLERRPRIIAAQAQIEELIEDAPDYRLIVDRRARDKEWSRQDELKAARRVLVSGAEYFSGVPALPGVLKDILGVTIEADGRQMPNWPGCLEEVDREIARLTPLVQARKDEFARHVANAEALLASTPETVSR